MGIARQPRASDTFSLFLAGLQAGMAAVLFMLAWLGLSAEWRQSSFWTPENLWASAFYGSDAIHRGFSTSTLSGLALYLLVYSIFGCLFAAALRGVVRPFRLALLGIVAAVGWYYLTFHLIWHAVSPLVWLLHAERPTLWGHVLYGAAIAQFPRYLPAAAPVPVLEPASVTTLPTSSI